MKEQQQKLGKEINQGRLVVRHVQWVFYIELKLAYAFSGLVKTIKIMSPSNILKKSFLYTATIFAFMLLQISYAVSPQGAVNILTPRGYLKATEISTMVRDRCGVEISCDEYYHSLEFLSRINSTRVVYQYDMVIFSKDLYDSIKGKIETKGLGLSRVVEDYSDNIKRYYLAQGYSSNVVFFAIVASGFTWNPAIINISMHDTLSSMFEKAKNNRVSTSIFCVF